MKVIDKQSAFNVGILTNKLRARDDLKQYANGLADANNFIVSKYGPVIKRTGTQFVWDAGNPNTKVQLIPFIYSVKQSLILEFIPGFVRFYGFDGTTFGPIVDPQNPGQQYMISSEYTADDIGNLSYAQSADVIYIACPNGRVRPKELRRHANNDWRWANYEFEDGPYLDKNYNGSKKITIDSTSTGSHGLTVAGFSLTQADVGRLVRFNHPDDTTLDDRWGWGVITAVSDATHATIDVKQKAWATSATSEFRLGAWGPAHTNEGTVGWPSLVTIHEQRLCWQGTTGYPWLWTSSSFNYHNFSPSDFGGVISGSNAIYYNMATDRSAPVKWMASLGNLIIGTELYEMRLYAAGAGLSPTDCVAKRETNYGVHDALPITVDDTLIFIQRLQRKLRSMAYDYARDAYVGPELSTLAESLTVSGMKKIVHQREPNDLVWVLQEDGSLLTMTYDKEQGVTGWTRIQIGGDDVKIVDLAVLPSDAYKQDILVLMVERTINNLTKRYIEILSREFLDSVELKALPYLDSSARYVGSPTTVITGLGHLEGQQIRVMNRGGIHADAVVRNGAVSFDYPVSDGWIGLKYDASFETLERDCGDNKQLSIRIGKVRLYRMTLYLLRTLGMTVTQKSRGLQTQLITFTPKSNMDTPPEPISGEKIFDIMTSWTSEDLQYALEFVSEPGLPCTVGGIYTGVEINAV